MSIIHKIINTPPKAPTTATLDWKDPDTGDVEKIHFQSPDDDAESIVKTMVSSSGQYNAFALSYSEVIKRRWNLDIEISPESVPIIQAVHRALVADPPIGEADIAYIMKTNGALFMAMLKTMFDMTGGEDAVELFLSEEAGKSSGGKAPGKSPSTSPSSGRPGRSRRP